MAMLDQLITSQLRIGDMSKMSEYLKRAANELGLGIEAPFRCVLEGGVRVEAVAHIPDLGDSNGVLIFHSSQYDRQAYALAKKAGYLCSSFGEPSESEHFDIDSYKEMFVEWGWFSHIKKPPPWMTSA